MAGSSGWGKALWLAPVLAALVLLVALLSPRPSEVAGGDRQDRSAVAGEPSGEGGASSSPESDLRRRLGVTFGGADFGAGDNIGVGSGDEFSNGAPGVHWTRESGGSYRYPDAASLRYLADRGVEVIRLTFRWERIQPDLRGDLDPDELALLDAAIGDAEAAGLEVIPTLMNYGAYWLDDGGVGVRQPIGSEAVPVEAFARTWELLSSALDHHGNMAAYGLMNEPVDIVGGAATWERAATEAAAAIRSTGSEAIVAVPTYQWSNVHRVFDVHPEGPWLDDSLQPVVYEVHHYFTAARSGDYLTYEEERRNAEREGWAGAADRDALTERSLAELEQYVAWLDGERGWVGEVGWPNDTDVEQWNQLGEAWFDVADAAGLWVTMWTTGSFWRDDYRLLTYRSSTGASGALDTPTAPAEVLERRL